MRASRVKWILVAFVVVAAVVVSVSFVLTRTGSLAPGDELKRDPAPYGWHGSKAVGSVFTDGFNYLFLTPNARGDIRLISARPLMDESGAVKVVGVRARVVPDMLPRNFTYSSVQDSPGFPSGHPDLAGAVPVNELVIRPSSAGQDTRWVEFQIGYEVVAEGRSARRGVEVTYEYDGSRHVTVIPSYLAICAPVTAECQPEHDE